MINPTVIAITSNAVLTYEHILASDRAKESILITSMNTNLDVG
jgi:hypothetical protein